MLPEQEVQVLPGVAGSPLQFVDWHPAIGRFQRRDAKLNEGAVTLALSQELNQQLLDEIQFLVHLHQIIKGFPDFSAPAEAKFHPGPAGG